jgi:hypothetical protein
MHLQITAGALALFATVATAGQTRISFYTAKDCSSGYIKTVTHDVPSDPKPPQVGFEFNVGTYVGGIAIDALDNFENQLNDENGCVFTDVTCCEYAPKCKEAAPTNNGGGTCITYDGYFGDGGVSATVCDSLCIDNGY